MSATMKARRSGHEEILTILEKNGNYLHSGVWELSCHRCGQAKGQKGHFCEFSVRQPDNDVEDEEQSRHGRAEERLVQPHYVVHPPEVVHRPNF